MNKASANDPPVAGRLAVGRFLQHKKRSRFLAKQLKTIAQY